MKISPRDYTLDFGQRHIIKQALTAFIQKQQGRLVYLSQAESRQDAGDAIARAQDMLDMFND